ncbi:MAG: DUF1298 domain-containing protein [Anaerolineae bacterium]|nr:DUF1298 domain-containing protein [Anaerolineae bacterium]
MISTGNIIMASEYHSDFLGPVDSAFYYVDTPKTPMNLGAITIFDGQLPYDELFKFIDSRIFQAPIYLKRIVQAPLSLSEPRWVLDPAFQTSRHVFHHELDAPGTVEQLRALAGHLVSGMLDRDKPLWQIHHISGLEDNRTALLFKIHHCMVDGLSAVELFTLLLDLTPDSSPLATQKVFYVPPPVPNPLEILASNVTKEIPFKVSVLQRLGSQALQLGSILTDRESRRKTFAGLANLISDNLTPIKKLLINGTNTGRMTLAWTDFPLAEVRAICTAQHASINEVMLAILGMGLGKYLENAGEKAHQDFVRVLAPVNVRSEEERGMFGNRIAVLPIDIPLYLEDPLKCLQRVVTYSQTMKQSRLSHGVDMLLTVPSLVNNFAQPVIWGFAPAIFAFLAHTWCTNVAGPQNPIYLMGHKMISSYGYFPLNASMGIASVIMSYNDKISLTVIADAGIIPDVLEIQRCLDKAYLVLRAAVGISPQEASNDDLPIEAHAAATATSEASPQVVDEPVESKAGSSNNSLNGNTSAVEEVPPPKQAEPTELQPPATPVSKPQRFRIFTEEWATAYKEVINSSSAYQEASTQWQAGAVAFIMHASSEHGFLQDSAVLLDLHRGHCNSAYTLPPREARTRAQIVLEGEYEDWIKALTGQAPPIAMIVRKKLVLTKGSLFNLLPFTSSAQELVHCAQKISESEQSTGAQRMSPD